MLKCCLAVLKKCLAIIKKCCARSLLSSGGEYDAILRVF
jgi:hypothetical protein